ncbi:MAG TPA: stimulus-sensing domain-containing protein, partial [Hyphomicrobium sp.]
MALETERTPAIATGLDAVTSGLRRQTAALLPWPRRALRRVSKAMARHSRWWQSTFLFRFLSASLLRRILAANLAGLVVVIGGIFYFSEHNVWLLEAKRESLRVQGEIIAAAIASDARIEPGRLIIPTDDLLSPQGQADDAFAAHELSIRPERVAPILRRLIQPTQRRARVYSRDGTLVMDSAALLMRGQLNRHEPKVEEGTRLRTKNFWTRLKSLMIGEELPVYREIGNANGTSYREVRRA